MNLSLIYQLLQEMARDDTEGNRPLHLVGNFEWFPHSCADVAAYLIGQGEDPNGRNLDGQTPLQALAERALLASDALDCDLQEREGLAEVLLDAGADPWAGEAVGISAGDAFPGLVNPGRQMAAARFH